MNEPAALAIARMMANSWDTHGSRMKVLNGALACVASNQREIDSLNQRENELLGKLRRVILSAAGPGPAADWEAILAALGDSPLFGMLAETRRKRLQAWELLHAAERNRDEAREALADLVAWAEKERLTYPGEGFDDPFATEEEGEE